MVGQQFSQRIAEALPQISLYKGAAALTAQEQPFSFQALDGLSQRRTGNIKLFRQLALRWQFFAWTQCSLEDQVFELLLDNI
ncbi:hypothetical protein D3C79_470580 [compost metagenome]